MPDSPEFVRVRITVNEDTPILQGTTATIAGVGFTGVSQITLDGAVKGAPPISEPGRSAFLVIPTKPGAGRVAQLAPQFSTARPRSPGAERCAVGREPEILHRHPPQCRQAHRVARRSRAEPPPRSPTRASPCSRRARRPSRSASSPAPPTICSPRTDGRSSPTCARPGGRRPAHDGDAGHHDHRGAPRRPCALHPDAARDQPARARSFHHGRGADQRRRPARSWRRHGALAPPARLQAEEMKDDDALIPPRRSRPRLRWPAASASAPKPPATLMTLSTAAPTRRAAPSS